MVTTAHEHIIADKAKLLLRQATGQLRADIFLTGKSPYMTSSDN